MDSGAVPDGSTKSSPRNARIRLKGLGMVKVRKRQDPPGPLRSRGELLMGPK